MASLTCITISILLISSLTTWAKDIVVIGGGLAGLTTAYEIQKAIDAKEIAADTRLQIFEAKERIGGRVLTVRLNGLPAELGGENINDGGDAVHLRKIAKELGLQIVSRVQQPTDRYFYDPKTKTHLKIDELKPFFPRLEKQGLIDALKKSEINARNIAEVLDHFFAMFPATNKTQRKKRLIIRRIIEENVRSFEGGAVKDLSPRYAHGSLIDITKAFLDRPRRSYPVDSISGGNSQLALSLANKLKDKIFLSSPLTSVDRALEGGYNLTINGHQDSYGDNNKIRNVHADVLILAIPCKPYANIRFAGDTIPTDRLQQISKVQYGTHAKILIPSTQKSLMEFPTTEGLLVWQRPGDQWFTAYFSGPYGVMHNQSEFQAGVDLVRQSFISPVPFKKDLGEIIIPSKPLSEQKFPVAMSWTTDPYIGGSYSYYTSLMREQLETTVTVNGETFVTLFAPIDGHIFFAGEHTTIDQDIRGTMEAAVESGVRTARLVKKMF